VPEKRVEPPLDIATEPVTVEPEVRAAGRLLEAVQEMTPEVPELKGVPPETVATAPDTVPPMALMEHDSGRVLEEPVLDQLMVQTGFKRSVHVVAEVVTVAVFVNVPKRPNTKPAIAIAAMSVIAMRITVANTGLIPLRLFFVRWALIVSS